MKKFFLFTLLLSIVFSYGQVRDRQYGFSQSNIWGELATPPKRTTPYKAKPAPPSAQAAEKARIAEMEKELQEADAAFEKEEYDKALAIYIKYKEHLDGVQCWNLGYIYYTTKDYTQAFYWYKKAAEAGNSDSMNNLGDMYRDGQGTTKDLEKAKYWYKKACEAGNQRGCDNLRNLN